MARLTTKGEHTRALILETALSLFRERGYDETTMRVISEKAGVALGNAYHYFPSKEHLVQAFYFRVHEEHLTASKSVLEAERDLKTRLRGVMMSLLDVVEPYHRFSGVLFRTAADPMSPLSPFGPESAPAREAATALFAKVVKESNARVPDDILSELPYLLWLYHMAIVLFWIHDDSPRQRRTRRLVESSVELITRAISLSQVPLLAPLRKAALGLITELRSS